MLPNFPRQPTLALLDADVRALVDVLADLVARLERHERSLNEQAMAIQHIERTLGELVTQAPAEWERLATRIEEVATQTALNAEILRAMMAKLGMER